MKTHLLVLVSLLALGLCGCGEDEVRIDIGGGLVEKEVTKTLAKVDGQNSISIYLISKTELKATLVAKAFDENGQEIGRSTTEVDLAEDDAKYVNFKFGTEVDATLVKSYLVDLKSVKD
ncbi:MAG: hypothetical protein VCA36_00285 [Opitutales bacterium]